jgi:membrane peptidoglycan carboxypeptidase
MDAKRITKAAWVNLTSGNPTAQGGSTITEQLARNIYFSVTRAPRSVCRRLCYRLQLERKFTKDEILEMYLNEIYYGNNADGCEARRAPTSRKSAKNLTISEAAFLAGLPQRPASTTRFENFDNAHKRMRTCCARCTTTKRSTTRSGCRRATTRKNCACAKLLVMSRARFIEERRKTERWESALLRFLREAVFAEAVWLGRRVLE